MAAMSRTEVHEAMLRHHALLEAEMEERVGAVQRAVQGRDTEVPEGSGYEPAVAELIAFLGDEVLPHAFAEEQTIYPAASRVRADLVALINRMLDEHKRLAELTEELASAETATAAVATSKEIAELFVLHVGKENDLVLPSLITDDNVDAADLLAQMHHLSVAFQEGAQSIAGVSLCPLDEVLLSLLLDATYELAGAAQADRACQLAAAAWVRLRGPRPDLAVRVTAALHRLARSATAAPVTFHAGPEVDGEQPDPVLDVRALAPAMRHESIFVAYGQLAPGAGFVLVNDHDPKPLQYQFEAEHTGQFTWAYLEAGPRTWRVRIGRSDMETLP